MTFKYNNKYYELMELVEPNSLLKSDILIIMEITYFEEQDGRRVLINKDEWEGNDMASFEYRIVNYFYGVEDDATNIENAQYFIDHEYDKNFNECKFYMMQLRKAQEEFENDCKMNNDTKGSLDALEYAQSDLYEWVYKNIEGEEE